MKNIYVELCFPMGIKCDEATTIILRTQQQPLLPTQFSDVGSVQFRRDPLQSASMSSNTPHLSEFANYLKSLTYIVLPAAKNTNFFLNKWRSPEHVSIFFASDSM